MVEHTCYDDAMMMMMDAYRGGCLSPVNVHLGDAVSSVHPIYVAMSNSFHRQKSLETRCVAYALLCPKNCTHVDF